MGGAARIVVACVPSMSAALGVLACNDRAVGGRAGAGRRAEPAVDNVTVFFVSCLGGRGGSCGLLFFSDVSKSLGTRFDPGGESVSSTCVETESILEGLYSRDGEIEFNGTMLSRCITSSDMDTFDMDACMDSKGELEAGAMVLLGTDVAASTGEHLLEDAVLGIPS